MNIQELLSFENEIADLFNKGKIKAPIHLYYGNENKLIKIFKKINRDDWVFCSWRSHYQCLLKGVPPEYLKEQILAGKSMVMNLPEYKIHCSSIVGGIPSIATGIAAANKMQGKPDWTWCWLGDMSAETGAFAEAYKYAVAQELPITFVIEDNELSVETPTAVVWGNRPKWYLHRAQLDTNGFWTAPNLVYYKYKNNKYPHAGAGIRVQF